MANGTLKVSNIETSSGSGTITLGQSGETISVPSGATLDMSSGTMTLNSSMKNTPAFLVRKSSNQTLSDDTNTLVTWDTEVYDTNSAFASNKFTVPSGEAGKYYLFTKMYLGAVGNSEFNTAQFRWYKNGSDIDYNLIDCRSNPGHQFTCITSLVLDLSVGDYIEIYAQVDDTSGSPIVAGSSDTRSSFMGYKLIGA